MRRRMRSGEREQQSQTPPATGGYGRVQVPDADFPRSSGLFDLRARVLGELRNARYGMVPWIGAVMVPNRLRITRLRRRSVDWRVLRECAC